MRVVVLSDLERYGGATIACARVADALSAVGHDVWRLVLLPERGDEPRLRILRPRGRVERALRRIPVVRRVTRGAIARRALRDALAELRPDVVNVHNLHAEEGGGSVDMVRDCLDAAPTVWTLHDMWSFTGRCAYAGSCAAHVTGCTSSCPTPDEYPRLHPALIARAWRTRRDLLRETTALAAVSPSRWLASAATAGSWRPRRVEVIPNGLPIDRFRPIDRATARAALRIEPRARVLLLAASKLFDPRKGSDLALDALREVRTRPLVLLVMGAGGVHVTAPGVDVVDLGPVDGPALQSVAYSAADLLLHPAREDNFPNTIVEALACGTPTVAFDVGGVADAVRPGVTGWLAPTLSAAALATAIDAALGDLERDDLRASCRRVAETEYDAALQAARYARLFEELRSSAR